MLKMAILLVSLFLILGISCAPAVSPSPPLAPQPAAPSAPALTPGEEAWQKVVAAANKEGKLTVYTYWTGEPSLMIQRGFRERTGIAMEFVSGKGADNLERLRTELRMGKMVADAYTPTTLHAVNASKYGLTTNIADLPALKEKGVWVLRPDAVLPGGDIQWVNIGYASYSSWVNTRLLSVADAPKSYKELLQPKWKDKIIAAHPGTHAAMYNMFVSLLNQRIVDMDYLRALGRQTLYLKPSTEASALALAQGERPFLLTGATSATNQYVAKGAPIRPVVMEEGTTVQMTPGAIAVKGAPNPNAAKVFVNWLITQNGQEVFGKALSTGSIRNDVADYTPVNAQFTAKKLINTTVEDLEQGAKMFTDRVFPNLWKE